MDEYGGRHTSQYIILQLQVGRGLEKTDTHESLTRYVRQRKKWFTFLVSPALRRDEPPTHLAFDGGTGGNIILGDRAHLAPARR